MKSAFVSLLALLMFTACQSKFSVRSVSVDAGKPQIDGSLTSPTESDPKTDAQVSALLAAAGTKVYMLKSTSNTDAKTGEALAERTDPQYTIAFGACKSMVDGAAKETPCETVTAIELIDNSSAQLTIAVQPLPRNLSSIPKSYQAKFKTIYTLNSKGELVVTFASVSDATVNLKFGGAIEFADRNLKLSNETVGVTTVQTFGPF